MCQNGAPDRTVSPAPAALSLPSVPGSPYEPGCAYTTSLSKADLNASLEAMYNRLAAKFQFKLHKTSHTLSQEISALGTRTDRLETKHDELAWHIVISSREHETLLVAFNQIQSQVENLDNRNRCNNLCLRGIPESVTDLISTIIKLFKSLLPDCKSAAFTYDRIHRALRTKHPVDKPPRDIILCMKDFLTTFCERPETHHIPPWRITQFKST